MNIGKTIPVRQSGKRKTQSLRIKLILCFLCFSIVLMALLWGLQVFAYQQFYESMKTREIEEVADSCLDSRGELSTELLRHVSSHDDMYIYVETANGMTLFESHDNVFLQPFSMNVYLPPRGESYDTTDIRSLLFASETGTASYTGKTIDGITTIVYGKTVEHPQLGTLYLSIFAPLEPTESTITILRKQLLIVSFVSLALAGVLAYFLSKRLAKPIVDITDTAKDLAKGNYGVAFSGKGCLETEELADTLTHASSELARTDELKKDLLANVSHDLRTPLTLIKSYAEMIRDLSGDDPEKRKEHLDVIISESDRLNLLVSDLLSLSRMQAGSVTLQKSPCSMLEEVQSVLKAFAVLEEQEGYRIRVLIPDEHTEPSQYTVLMDSDRIRQVLTNLVANAVRYSSSDQQIEVAVSEAAPVPDEHFPGGVRVEVRDHGIGISKEDLEHIWERYYRSSETAVRAKSGGSGLGLAITKEILELHHARYGAESVPGNGSTFWFELPR